jgi:mono/diheme cytochrome c family protein
VRAPLFLLLASCTIEGVLVTPEASLERMIEQPKLDAYEASATFGNGRAMQLPPAGTVPYRKEPFDPVVERGMEGPGYAGDIPIPIDIALLERGRNRFEIFCATCHGVAGNGQSEVAEQMNLVKPPSLLSDRIRAYPPGRIFRVATEGFGVMPSYRTELSTPDRWAVVAYVQALQLRDRAVLDELPPDIAAEAQRELP